MIIKYLANSWPSLEDKDKFDLDETKRPNLGLLKALLSARNRKGKENHEPSSKSQENKEKGKENQEARLFQGGCLLVLCFPSYIKVNPWNLDAFLWGLMLVLHVIIS